MNNNVNSSFPNFEEFTSSFNSSNSEFDSFSENSNNVNNPFSNIDMNTIFKVKQVMEKMNNNKNDPRSNLLLSLKPYLKPSRKQKVDQYIQLFNMGAIMESFKENGGESKK